MILQDRVIAMTGASGAIGRVLSRAFAREGARLLIGYRANAASAEALASETRDAGGQSAAVQVDVSEPDQAARFVQACVERYGRLDVMFNNAGGLGRVPFLETTPEMWRRALALNADGSFYCTQAAARQMIAQGGGGKIVNMSSVAADSITTDYVPYCAAKAALNQLTRGSAAALACHGITVNALAPGVVETERVKVRLAQGANRARLLGRTPAGRLVQPDDLVDVAVFLVSARSDHLTGQILTMDHGFSLVGIQWDPEPR
ncbi:MAG: SDR family NAD(P)-dependent oxidoreductase [Armatimonadota bacterium]